MVTKTDRCSFTQFSIVPGRGRRLIGKDGRINYLISTKARKLFTRKIKPVKLTWTTAWRAFNKKIKIDDSHKKRTKKTAKVQKAVVGMSLDEIKRRKAESREDRNKASEAREKEVKDRKMKLMKEKKDKKAKEAKGGKPKGKDNIKSQPAGGGAKPSKKGGVKM